MNILLSVHEGLLKKKYFPEYIMADLGKLGKITENTGTKAWTESELSAKIKGMDICITHWGSPAITEKVLENADKLKLVAHCAGSVFNIVVPKVYKQGIKVISANRIMAMMVAEGTLAYILASQLKLMKYTSITEKGGWKTEISDYGDMKTLFNKKILLVGFGDIGRLLYSLLVPFDVSVSVYDPFLKSEIKAAYNKINFVEDLDASIAEADIISLHASQNPGSKKLIGRKRIDLIKDGALFINTARGSIVDEKYLTQTLKSRRIYAALDVYETEPLPKNSELRTMPNVLCLPHMAGTSAVTEYTEALAEDIGNFINGRHLIYEITAEKAGMMTQA